MNHHYPSLRLATHQYTYLKSYMYNDGDRTREAHTYQCPKCGATVDHDGTQKVAVIHDYHTYQDYCPAEWTFNPEARQFEESAELKLNREIQRMRDMRGTVVKEKNAVYAIYSTQPPVNQEDGLWNINTYLRTAYEALEGTLTNIDKWLSSHEISPERA